MYGTIMVLSKFKWYYFRTINETTLQMLKAVDIENFYKHVNALGLKFPVAAIAKETGFSKGNVSDYLKKVKEPSENFIKKVYEAFPESTKKVPHDVVDKKEESHEEPISKELHELIESNRTLAESNKTQAEANKIQAEANNKLVQAHAELISMLKSKEGEISSDVQRFVLTQAEILALLKAAIEVDVDYKAKGDEVKANEMAAKINRSTASNLGLGQKKGNPFAGKKHS